ncbi:MAG: four helix bundle protein [Oscillospiraceae bacterium]|nr:four helix bundle protein [Oscillospiraceae bacterium]
MQKEDSLSTQSLELAVEILALVKRLQEQHEYVVSRQIGKSGTSIGANIREARHAHSRADFIAKMQIALKEANETGYWLELLFRSGHLEEDAFRLLEQRCSSIRIMLIRSIQTAKKGEKRMSEPVHPLLPGHSFTPLHSFIPSFSLQGGSVYDDPMAGARLLCHPTQGLHRRHRPL